MNYDRYANDPINSPMFDGSDSSMGGNGAKSDYAGVPQPFPRPYDKIPSAGGGGCVTTGPFKKSVFFPLPDYLLCLCLLLYPVLCPVPCLFLFPFLNQAPHPLRCRASQV